MVHFDNMTIMVINAYGITGLIFLTDLIEKNNT